MTTVFVEVFWTWGELAASFCYRSVLGWLTGVFMSQSWRIQGLIPLFHKQKHFSPKCEQRLAFSSIHCFYLHLRHWLSFLWFLCFSCCRLQLFWCSMLSRTLQILLFADFQITFWNDLCFKQTFHPSFILFSSFLLVGEISYWYLEFCFF